MHLLSPRLAGVVEAKKYSTLGSQHDLNPGSHDFGPGALAFELFGYSVSLIMYKQ